MEEVLGVGEGIRLMIGYVIESGFAEQGRVLFIKSFNPLPI